jgi:phage-related tail protein
MKTTKISVFALCALLLLPGCASMSNTAKGGLIGGGSGAAAGALIGALIGNGKGAAIGAGIGAAVGTGAGVLIGNKMDKAKRAAEAIQGAEAELMKDA